MNMKKIISGLLVIAGTAAFAGTAGADEAIPTEPTIRFGTVKVDETADTVKIDVFIENNPGFVSATFPVTWDDSVLKLVDIQDYHTTVTSGWIGYEKYSEITDTYYLAWNNDTIHGDNYGEYNFEADGKLCTMVFELLDAAEAETEYTISADLDDPLANMMNWDMEDYLNSKESDGIYELTIQFVDGKITIGAPDDYILGDVDGNGEVNASDRMTLARTIAEWPDYPMEKLDPATADINDDGNMDGFDRMILARHIADWPDYKDLSAYRTGN